MQRKEFKTLSSIVMFCNLLLISVNLCFFYRTFTEFRIEPKNSIESETLIISAAKQMAII